jgi:hypothetical protein
MSKALPSLEGIQICKNVMVPVWQFSHTEETRAAAIREAWALRDLLSAAHPHGVRLSLARSLSLRNRESGETTPRTISFIDDPLYVPTPDDLLYPHRTSFRRFPLDPALPGGSQSRRVKPVGIGNAPTKPPAFTKNGFPRSFFNSTPFPNA